MTATIGEQIRDRRTDLGLSQEQLAARLDSQQGRVSAWETGRIVPTGAKLSDIADALDCDVRLVPRGGAA